MIAVLGACRKDDIQAIRWLEWVNTLKDDRLRLIITVTMDIQFPHPIAELARMFPAHLAILPDLQENGYPGSASHLFVRSLEIAGELYPEQPILWLEPDAIPIEDGWFTAIEEEYIHCGYPFMGHLELKANPPHMAGVGVYPHNWDALAPRIRQTLTAPDHHAWGKGCGQAWDMWAGRQILPMAKQSETIQQVWKCPSFTPDMLNTVIGPKTMLFHQSKDGKLIELLKQLR